MDQIMACHLFGAKPFPEAMMASQFDPHEQIYLEFGLICKSIHVLENVESQMVS